MNGQAGLSDGALEWMTAKLRALGVLFTDPPRYAPDPNARGEAHEPWASLPWTLLRPGPHPRDLRAGLGLHRSVVARMRADAVLPDPNLTPARYAPTNLGAYVRDGVVLQGVSVV